jgi:hypothetical protein
MIPYDWFVYTATKQFFDGFRMRRYFVGIIKDFSEEAAKEFFEWLDGVASRRLEAVDE